MDKQKKADLALVIITFFWGIANLISDYMMGLMMTGMAMTKLNVVMLEEFLRPYIANR